MVLIGLFLLAGAYLCWIVYYTYKRDMPQWMHAFFEHQRKIKPWTDKEGNELYAVGLFQNLLILLSVVSLCFLLQMIGLGYEAITNSPIWFLTVIAIVIVLVWQVGKNLASWWGYYLQRKKTDAEQTLKDAYGVKDWATGNDIRNRLSSKK